MPAIAWAGLAVIAAAGAPDAVGRFIRNTLKALDYERVEADLNADGRAEVFIYVRDTGSCGSGGCTLYVLSPEERGHRLVMRATLVNPPVMLLPTSTDGWGDIGVTVSGGGIAEPYVARLRYEGGRYPSNPTMPPARPLGRATGKVLIGG